MSNYYSLYDSASKSFGPLYEVQSDAAAIRLFRKSFVKDPDFLDDFSLFKLGTKHDCPDNMDSTEYLSKAFVFYTSPVIVIAGSKIKEDLGL